jgi:micrococcal nuclease
MQLSLKRAVVISINAIFTLRISFMNKNLAFIIIGIFYSLYASAQPKITIAETSEHYGETVTICDVVYSGKFIETSKLTLLDMGGPSPKNKLTVLINFADRKNFPGKPETFYENKDACITGKLVEFKGKPEIIVTKPSDIQIGTE